MPVYIVGFDVRNSSARGDYSGLQNAVAKLERHRLMPWLYLVSVPLNAAALKEYLLNHMSGEDRLWISKVSAKAKFEFAYQTTGGTSAWLKKHSRIELPVPPPATSPMFFNKSTAASPSKNVVHEAPNVAKVNGRHARYAANT